MKLRTPAFYRARLAAIRELASTAPKQDVRFFRAGYVPESYRDEYEQKVQEYIPHKSNKKLHFSEMCSYSTWFEQHPEKIAGREIAATSVAFPVQIKGNRKDVETMFKQNGIQPLRATGNAEEDHALVLALALELELELLELENQKKRKQ